MESKTKKIVLVVAVVAMVILGGLAWTLSSKDDDANVIYYAKVAPALQKDLIADGTYAGGASWEPYVSDSVVAGTAKVLVWSGDIWPNHPCCVIAVDSDFAADHPDLVARVLKANIVASLWILDTLEHPESENYTLLMNAGAAFSARSTSVVENATEHIIFATELTQSVKDDLAFFVEQFVDLGIIDETKLADSGYDNATDFINSIVDTSYLDLASDIEPSATILGNVRLGYLTGDLHQFARVIAMDEDLWGGKDLFEVYGVNLVIDTPAGFANGAAEMDAFASGAIDMGYLGAPPVLQKALNAGVDVKIVSLVNEEGSAIIVSNDINDISDLAGKTIATPGEGSIQHLLLMYWAEENGYELKLAGVA
jgi:NitT/TauT family transport system substrate-binding protein